MLDVLLTLMQEYTRTKDRCLKVRWELDYQPVGQTSPYTYLHSTDRLLLGDSLDIREMVKYPHEILEWPADDSDVLRVGREHGYPWFLVIKRKSVGSDYCVHRIYELVSNEYVPVCRVEGQP